MSTAVQRARYSYGIVPLVNRLTCALWLVSLAMLSAACLDPILRSAVPTHPIDGGGAVVPDGGGPVAFGPCLEPVSGTDGHHNAGMDCLSCHAVGMGQAPEMVLAGTLYSAAMGGTAVGGATVEVLDATGKSFKMTTADVGADGLGNFYAVSKTLQFPVKVRATKCPDSHEMVAPVVAGQGGCNASGCHESTMRVFLP